MEIERRLYMEIREAIAREGGLLRRLAAGIAQLDVLVNFRDRGFAKFSRPEFTETALGKKGKRGVLMIAGGRHPVIEKLLEERGERLCQ